jgi:6-phosphofructokinase 1
MVVQVMGRDAGHLTLQAGIAGGADVILIPELTPYLTHLVVDEVCQKITQLRQAGRQFALVVIAEGIRTRDGQKKKYIGDILATELQGHSEYLCSLGEAQYCVLRALEARAMTLGHMQRSGPPTATDRLLAAAFGKKAIDLIAAEQYNQMVIWKNGQVASQPLDQVIPLIKQRHTEQRCPYPVDPAGFMVATARDLGICLGDPSPSP